MLTFAKAQAASLAASSVDFLVTILAVELFGLWYVAATVTGTVTGGVAHFSVSRSWVFKASDRTISPQLVKYFMVWNGSLALNASGVFVLTHFTGTNYILSKVCVSILVGFFYNYLIQKRFVFK